MRGGKSLWREKADKMVTPKRTHGVLEKKRRNANRPNVCEVSLTGLPGTSREHAASQPVSLPPPHRRFQQERRGTEAQRLAREHTS